MLSEFTLPTNFAGRDGFYWWIGQIESDDKGLKQANRFKVRIVGHHLRDCNSVKTEDLPWAQAMLPATTPYSTGNSSGASANFKQGDWVVGFFLDGHEGQQPIIMGSIGAVPNATNDKPKQDPNPGQSCKAFTTFIRKDFNPAADEAAKTEAKDKNKNQAGVPPAAGGNATAPNTLLALPCDNSEANPFGNKFCVTLADAQCTEDTTSAFQRILSELLLNVQNSNGRIGSSLISKYTGQVFNYVNVAQGYINRMLGILSNLIGYLKGEIVKLIRKGVDALLKAILTPKNGGLKSIVEFMKKQLEKVGCTLDGLLDRLISWLTNLIMNWITSIVNAASCQIDNLVSGMISQLQNYINGAISNILGALQSILNAIAAPLDLIGSALKYVMDLLGITCTGLGKCNKNKESCSEPKQKKSNNLDDILSALENGGGGGGGYCSEAFEEPDVIPTDVIFVGGDPVTTVPDTGTTTPAPVSAFPTYAVTANRYTASEGDNITYLISTTETPDGTSLAYEMTLLSGTVASQITGASPTGTVTVTNNSASLTVSVVDDTIEEPEDYLTFTLFDTFGGPVGSVDVTILASDSPVAVSLPVSLISNSIANINLSSSTYASSNFNPASVSPGSFSYSTNNGLSGKIVMSVLSGATVSPKIQTTSASVAPTYRVTANRRTVREGESIIFTITTTNVADNTRLSYTMFGVDIQSSDFVLGTNIGTFSVVNNTSTVTVDIASDTQLEGIENCVFAVDNTGAQVDFSILGEPPSNTFDDVEDGDGATEEPVACEPEVDENGKILSIDICSKGTPYTYPPNVLITGTGFGATATAVLDEDGYVSEVKVLTPGIGYQPNTNDKNCIITGFHLIRPGTGYSSAPIVYVNGDSSIARAKIQEGRVIGFDIVNKTKVFTTFPEVEIFGDGYGALAIPFIGCVPTEELNRIETETIAELSTTGSYVDCP
jgi:hypothetical protein